MSDKLVALLENSGTELSEDAKVEINAVFEAAVNDQVQAVLESEREAQIKELQEMSDSYVNDVVVPELVEKMDNYLTYAVSEWKEENKLAIEAGAKVELAESLIGGMKGLFENHNLEVSQEQVDAVAVAESKVGEVQSKLDSKIDENIALQKEIKAMKRDAVVARVCEGLAETEVEKFGSLIESIELGDDVEHFEKRIVGIKESYFPKGKPAESAPVVEEEEGHKEEIVTESLDPYLERLRQGLRG